MLTNGLKNACGVMLASVGIMSLSACDSSGGMRVAGVGQMPPTPDDGAAGGDGSGGSGNGGSGSGSGSGSGGSTSAGGSGAGGSGGSSGGGGGTGGGGTGTGTGTGGMTSGLLANLPIGGVVGPDGLADTGLLANTGNPSNTGAIGTVLVTAGNAVLGVNGQTPTLVQAVDTAVPGSVPIAGTVSRLIGSTGQALVDTGSGKTYLVDGLTAAVGEAVSLNVLNKDVLPGSGTQLVGASVLSTTQNSGSLATVGVDSAGNIVKAVATPLGTDNATLVSAVVPGSTGGLTGATGQLVGATAGTTPVLGTSGVTPVIGASVLSPTQATGSLATVGVGSGGNVVTAAVGPVAGAGGSVTGSTSILPTDGLATVTAGNTTVLNGGANPAIGASVLSPIQATGSAVTAGLLSAGNLATGTVGSLTAPLGGAASGSVNAGATTGTSGLVGGLLN